MTPRSVHVKCGRQGRLRDRYEWGHITKEEYLAEHDAVQRELRQLSWDDGTADELSDLAGLLTSVSEAWDQAEQEQRNGLAKTLFEEIMVEDGKVVAVKPREEVETLFFVWFQEWLAKFAMATPIAFRFASDS